MTERFRIGVITSVHGVRGEVKVFPTTDEPKKFSRIKKVYVDNSSTSLTNKNNLVNELEIEQVKYFKNLVIIKFSGIDTPEKAKFFIKSEIYVDRKDAIALKENENYISDLIGLKVITDEGLSLGTVFDVFPTGANHVLEVITEEKKHILMPYIKECILEVKLDEEKIVVHLLNGLLDIYN